MIRFSFRFVGLLGLALAFIFAVYDGTKSIANHKVELTSVERLWNETYSKPPQDVVKPLLAPIAGWLWDPLSTSVLDAPVWLVLVVLASLLTLLGRKKKRLIGYARD
jgi:hypothetical protein